MVWLGANPLGSLTGSAPSLCDNMRENAPKNEAAVHTKCQQSSEAIARNM